MPKTMPTGPMTAEQKAVSDLLANTLAQLRKLLGGDVALIAWPDGWDVALVVQRTTPHNLALMLETSIEAMELSPPDCPCAACAEAMPRLSQARLALRPAKGRG